MNTYLPYSEKHSVQEAQIALHFQAPFDRLDIERARNAAEAELKGALPRAAEILGGTFTIDATSREMTVAPPQPALAGFERSRVRGDGKPACALRLADAALSVNVANYEGWEITRCQSVAYMLVTLSQLPLNVNPVMRVSLQFIDKYAFNGALDDADARLLFRDDSEYIARRCFAAGLLWHCHTGWFDQHSHGRILNHLNIASAVIDECPTITIDHNAVLQLNLPRQSTESLLEPAEPNAGINAILNGLYNGNRAILGNILTPEMYHKAGRLPQ